MALEPAIVALVLLAAVSHAGWNALVKASGQIDPLVTDFREAAQAATASLQAAEGLLAGFQGLAPRDSALAHEITTTLRSVSGAMNSVKNLATYLERHPEALLMGK